MATPINDLMIHRVTITVAHENSKSIETILDAADTECPRHA